MKNITQLRAKQTGAISGTYHEVMHALSGGGAIVEFFPSGEGLAPEAMTADLMRRSNVEEAVRALPMISDRMVGGWCTLDVSAEGIAERLVEMAKPLPECDPDELATALRTHALPRVINAMTRAESHRSASAHSAGLASRAIRDGKILGLGTPLGYTEAKERMSQEDALAAYLEALDATLNAPTFPYYLSHVLAQMLTARTGMEAAK